MTETARRPIRTRSARWAQALGRAVAATGLGANAVSMLGVLLAAAGAASLLLAPESPWGWVGGAAGIQLRLLANMLDGLVAVEGGRATATGPLFNELPDRVEDVLLLEAAGYAAGAPELGHAASLLALTAAYIRATGGALGLAQDFAGPLAKPQRMFALTVGVLATAASGDPAWTVYALGVIVAGTALTCARRTLRIARLLRAA
jgi:phosphatidylglycerophosphate synthase